MILVRDAAGVKPLYWTRTSGGFAFASEIKALRPVPGIDWSPDPVAIASYLTLLYAPGDLTPARGIRKLQPGEIMEWCEDALPVVRRFAARPNEQGPHDLSTADAVEACHARHASEPTFFDHLQEMTPLTRCGCATPNAIPKHVLPTFVHC